MTSVVIMSSPFGCSLDRSLDRIGFFSSNQSEETLYLKVQQPEEVELLMDMTKRMYTSVKTVKIACNILCCYKADTLQPLQYYSDLLGSRFA